MTAKHDIAYINATIQLPKRVKSLLGVLLGPELGLGDGRVLVLLPSLGDVIRERVVGVGRAEERLDGQQDRPDLQRGRPLVLQDVETDTAELVCTSVQSLTLPNSPMFGW